MEGDMWERERGRKEESEEGREGDRDREREDGEIERVKERGWERRRTGGRAEG